MIPYTAQITDEITGVLIAEELPCMIEVEVIGEDVRVEDVRVDGISLYKGTPLSIAVASQVAEKALADDDFVAKALADHGVPAWDTPAMRRELGTVF